jgi:hypothetical protein
VGEGVKETWRTGVVFIIVWIVVREYTAGNVSYRKEIEEGMGTLVLISVDSVVYIFGIFKVVAHHIGSETSVLCVIMKEMGMLPAQVAVLDHLHHGVRLQECLSTIHPRRLALGARPARLEHAGPCEPSRRPPTLTLSHLKHSQLLSSSRPLCFDVIASHT